MPEWLAAVLTAAGVSVAGQALAYVVVVNVLGVRIDDHNRRIGIMEEAKLDAAIHSLEVRRIDERVEANEKAIVSAGHRMNNFDQRITSVDERVHRIHPDTV